MNQAEVKKLKLGLYHIFWNSRGSSLAAVGMTEDGNRWLAPINWVNPSEDPEVWGDVLRAEMIDVAPHQDKNEPSLQMVWTERDTSAMAEFGPTNVLNVTLDSFPLKDSLNNWDYTIMMFGTIVGSSGEYRTMRSAQIAAEQNLARILLEFEELGLELYSARGANESE